jgi:hypothetical protein
MGIGAEIFRRKITSETSDFWRRGGQVSTLKTADKKEKREP